MHETGLWIFRKVSFVYRKRSCYPCVSKDSVASHKRFEEKYGLAFPLLADPERKVIEAYDVWKEKKNYGKVSMGVVRTTYLIDEQGIIIKANDKVKAADDPENMLKELAE